MSEIKHGIRRSSRVKKRAKYINYLLLNRGKREFKNPLIIENDYNKRIIKKLETYLLKKDSKIQNLDNIVQNLDNIVQKLTSKCFCDGDVCKNVVYLYVLECRWGKYYVGVSNDANRRFKEHMNGNGSEWTKLYEPNSEIERIKLCKNDPEFVYKEDNKVLELMIIHGIDNVRGGSYSKKNINKREVKNRLNHINNACFYCGKAGHYSNRCPAKFNFR